MTFFIQSSFTFSIKKTLGLNLRVFDPVIIWKSSSSDLDIICSSERPALSTRLSLCVSFSLPQMRRHSRQESKSRSTRRMNRLSSISWDSEWLQASRRSSPAKNSGYQMIVLFVNFSVLDSSQNAQDRDGVSLMVQCLVLVSTAACFYSFICLFCFDWNNVTPF